tara:strand:- start:7450 stop:7626 length:177 start_codon:yes stop_codon:yes gene_type:complete
MRFVEFRTYDNENVYQGNYIINIGKIRHALIKESKAHVLFNDGEFFIVDLDRFRAATL